MIRFLVLRFCVALAFCCLFAFSSSLKAQELRKWTSANGEHWFEAELVSFENGIVTIKGRDGKKKTMDASRLSKADQKFLAEFVSGSTEAKISKAQKEKLKELGLKVSGDGFSFADDRNLKSAISKAKKTKKKLVGMEVQLRNFRIAYLQAQNQMVMLRRKDVQLNNMLATPGLSVSENNQLVGQTNANRSQIELLQTDIETAESQIKEAQSFVNKSREEFVDQLLGVRKLSDSFDEKAIEMKENEDFKAILGDIEETLGRQMSPLGESKSLARMRKDLGKLESIVLTDTIKLNDDGSGTFEATVSLNGKEPIELVVDSGASLVTIPAKLAAELNIKIGPDAPRLVMTIADGSKIPARLVILESVRLGKFTATNVECAVLGREAVNAPNLLGMSFLGNFKFELDASRGELKMITIETDDKK